MVEEFYKIRRLPPYMFEEVNKVKARLRAKGIGRLFGPGTPTTEAIAYVKEWFAEQRKAEA